MLETPSTSAILDDAARSKAASAASWGAILAGAVVAVAVSLILVTLGAGLGFASVSPWSDRGLSAPALTTAGTVWLVVTQWFSAAAGGYLAGRLRHRWLATHTHEVFFRDTAHGLVTWSVATLIAAVIFTSSLAGVLGRGARAAAESASGAGPGTVYDLDRLFRGNGSGNSADSSAQGIRSNTSARDEAMHIAAHAAASGTVGDDDRAYLVHLVATQTGVSTDEAQKRIAAFSQTLEDARVRAKSVTDEARESAARAALYTTLALLVGAFIASVSAAIGGRLRDEHA